MEKPLPRGRWRPENHRRLAEFLETIESAAADGSPVAVFDLDNTVIRGDTGSLFFLDAIEHLRFEPDDPGFRAMVNLLGDGEGCVDCLIRARAGHIPASDFRDAMIALYHRIYARGGVQMAYPWATQVMSGMRVDQVRECARALARMDRARPFEVVTHTYPGGRSVYCLGNRPYPEMVELMDALVRRGVRIEIVTGTAELVAEEYVREFDLPAARVHGMRTEEEDGRLTTRLVHPAPVAAAKLDVVRLRVGVRPCFVAGDSPSDLAMLLYSAGPSLLVGEEDGELGALAREKDWLIQPPFDGPTPKPT